MPVKNNISATDCALTLVRKTWPKQNKYRNIPTVIDGIRFASKKEARVYTELKLLKHAGKIVDFELQKNFPLCIDNEKICTYRCDFVAYYPDGRREVIDVKGVLTDVYKIKRALMKAIYKIEIVER